VQPPRTGAFPQQTVERVIESLGPVKKKARKGRRRRAAKKGKKGRRKHRARKPGVGKGPEAGKEGIEKIVERPGTKEKTVEKVREKIVERHRAREKVVERPAPEIGRGRVGHLVDRAIKEKAAGSGLSKGQVDSIEDKLGQLLQRYKIPENALAAHIQTLDSSRLVQDFQRLIRLIETKRESASAELIRPAPGFDIKSGIIAKKREKIVGKEKDIRKAKIETSFDKVLNIVQLKGVIGLNDVAKQLQMNKREVQECAEVLERSKLIKLIYPPIGSVKLASPQYLDWKVQERKKKGREKKKNKK